MGGPTLEMQEYLGLFLDESRENLQSLNASILDLERAPEDPAEALNTIFRVAHSLKGMSATMGFDRMAGLTHRMEEVLSSLRDGGAPITTRVTDVLFACLDTLEGMVENVSEGGDGAADTTQLMEQLSAILNGDAAPEKAAVQAAATLAPEAPAAEAAPAPPAGDDPAGEPEADVALSDYERMMVGEAAERGMHVHTLRVSLEENCMLKAARAYMVVQAVEQVGELIKSEPSTEDLEREAFETSFVLWVTSDRPEDEIRSVVMDVSEVESCEVLALGTPAGGEDAPADPAAAAPAAEAAAPAAEAP
ncbi:MAG: Hpt domain-containing protein, partial [Thermoleophilia bacterium]|nr:Hpt domain-containing protein [Thermoleophilia bacterium]